MRDIYAVDDERLLIIQTDRLSAFDVVLPTPVPGKGEVLTALSNFWFDKLRHIISNHLLEDAPESLVTPGEHDQVTGRAFVARRLHPLPIEAIVRGYLAGSGWSEYQNTGAICGIALPSGLQQSARLPQAIFTPSTKAPAGVHDENIPFATAEKLLGARAVQIRDKAIQLTPRRPTSRTLGIIIADTKFEFGTDTSANCLIDEALTPDSSRFWAADQYRVGISPPSFDKQFVRDWLEAQKWTRNRPPLRCPSTYWSGYPEYRDALRLIQPEQQQLCRRWQRLPRPSGSAPGAESGAVRSIFAAKHRPANHPVIVHLEDAGHLPAGRGRSRLPLSA